MICLITILALVGEADDLCKFIRAKIYIFLKEKIPQRAFDSDVIGDGNMAMMLSKAKQPLLKGK